MKKVTLILLMLSLVLSGCSLTKDREAKDILAPEEAKAKAEEFINSNLMNGGTASITEISEGEEIYMVKVDIGNGQVVDSYITQDGKKFFMQALNIEEIESQKQAQEQAGQASNLEAEIQKSDKPVVELFVMSFCPYGVQAENSMAPVVDLLGDKVDFKVRFIANASGDDLDSISSLHGNIEGVEDARQLCIAKNYDQEKFWDYVLAINKDCYPIYSQGEDKYNACWQKAAVGAGLNVDTINNCLSSEGVALIKEENKSATGYGVTGSPTLIINGGKYQGSRTPEGYKAGICDAFNNPPEECNTKLDSSSGDTQGGC